MDLNTGIYQIKNIANNHCYIGSAVNFKDRWKRHKSHLIAGDHHSRYLQNAYNKYGIEILEFEILANCEKENLIYFEQKLINLLKPKYNICKIAGSSLGYKHTKKSREKMSESHLGVKLPEKTRRKMSIAKFNTTEETRKKMSIAAIGRIINNETRLKISISNSGKERSEEFKKNFSLSQKGEGNNATRLTWKEVNEIRELYKTGEISMRLLAFKFDVSYSCINFIINKKTWIN
jgi:group I intron endonuclease